MAGIIHSGVPSIPGIQPPSFVSDAIKGIIANHLGRNSTNFPGAQPVSFCRAHIQELLKEDYYLCEKTDGIRCLLWLDQDEDGNEAAYLIDRKNEYYFLEGAHFPHADDPNFDRCHHRTLIDGELVNDEVGRPGASQKRLRFLAFDCLILHGDSIVHRNLSTRLGKLHNLIAKPYQAWLKAYPDVLSSQAFELRAKDMEFAYGLSAMFKDKLHRLPHGNDGLIFTCLNMPYRFGTDDHIVKWKPPHENTVDFEVRIDSFPMIDPEDGNPELVEDWDAIPEVTLLIGGGRNILFEHGKLHMEQSDWDAVKASCEAQDKIFDHRIVECFRDDQGQWRMKIDGDGTPRFRDDKDVPNHCTTVDKVTESIEDAVTEEELIRNEAEIRAAWKKRAASAKAARQPPGESAAKRIKTEP